MPALCLRDYSLVGLSHKTARVEVRERLAIAPSELPGFLSALQAAAGADELMLVSTCNRVEAYAFGGIEAPELWCQALVSRAGQESSDCFYVRRGADAVAHLFRVASSLDSMILGEPQILGQVKRAFSAAKDAGTVGAALDHACQAAFAAAKRVRTETGIGASPVSMASAAVELARKVFGGLRGGTVLLIGAGKTSELTAKQLAADGLTVLVTNRTLERAEALAVRVGGVARPFSALPELLMEADIVVSSTAAPAPILGVAVLEPVVRQRHYRPLFLVDLAVPRDIEPEVGRLENVFAYDVDDLGRVVAEGREARAVEAGKAERIVEAEVERFVQGRRVRGTVPVLALLRARAEQIASAEAQRTLAEFGEAITARQRRSVEAMARAIVNKLLTSRLCGCARRPRPDGARRAGSRPASPSCSGSRPPAQRRTRRPSAEALGGDGMKIRIGTRRSPLALWQARHVGALLREREPGLEIELVEIVTKGDKIIDAPLAKVGGKGLFVKEIEEKLLAGAIDLAVHSLKDMPAVLPEGLVLAAIPEREDPRDAFVSSSHPSLRALSAGARVGTSSLRRACQLKAVRPDLEVVPIRGNVQTRLGGWC